MKKIKYLLLMLLCIPFVAYAASGSANVTYAECLSFADYFKTLSGQQEYKYCYRAGCDTGHGNQWSLANMRAYTYPGYACSNGNTNPYSTITSDGCSKYKGSCSVTTEIFCTRVAKVDCNRKADGSQYSGTTTPVQPTDKKKTVTVSPSQSQTKTREKYTGTGKVIISTTEKTSENGNTRPVVTTETTTTEPVKSGNVGIRRILVNGTDLKYHNEYNEYTIKLKKGVRDLDVYVETEDEKASIYIEGANNMSDEDNVVSVIVEAENGDRKVVTIKVKRYEGESNDCNIANIAITDYDIAHFDKNNYDYTISIKNKTKSLNMEIIPSDPLHADYEIKGNENLSNNSIVTVQVKAEDGTMCYYTIKVRKTSGFWIVLIIIIIITIVLLLAGYLVYRYMKRSKNQYEYE